MKKKYAEDDSDNEFSVDEPEELQESDDDDWTPGATEGTGRRQSRRPRAPATAKKPRLAEPASSEEEDEEEEEEEEEEESLSESDDEYGEKGKKKRGRGGAIPSRGRGRAKRITAVSLTTPSAVNKEKSNDDVSSTTTSENTLPIPVEKEFTSGAFVVLKSDFVNQKDPPIWKIDGKALLQKYIPFEQDGKTLYKNTSTYSGWSTSRKDDFYPAPITFKLQNRKETIIEFLREKIVVEDSD